MGRIKAAEATFERTLLMVRANGHVLSGLSLVYIKIPMIAAYTGYY